MKLRRTIEEEVEIEAGDLLEWRLGGEHIKFIVIYIDDDELRGITLYDNRSGCTEQHFVDFSSFKNLLLLGKAKDIQESMFI